MSARAHVRCRVRGYHSRRLLALGALVALTLLTACAQSSTGAHGQPGTPAATTTAQSAVRPTPAPRVIQASSAPVPVSPPQWARESLPSGFGLVFHGAQLQVAAADGMTAYLCGAPNGTPPVQVLVSHNGGRSWQRMADPPITSSECGQLSVDMLAPTTVIMSSGSGSQPGGIVATFDGGATWQSMPTSTPIGVGQFATRGSRTYAIVESEGGNSVATGLEISDDRLRTFTPIDSALTSSGVQIEGFWINPSDGSLIAEGMDGFAQAPTLWLTRDDGQHWTPIRSPVSPSTVQDYAVEQPRASVSWRICARFEASATDPTVSIACSADLGQTWTVLPDVVPGNTPLITSVALPSDGSVLAFAELSNGQAAPTLMRLPSEATQWQSAGTVPGAGATYYPTADGGILWAVPAESDGAGDVGPGNVVYSAAYPFH